MAQSDVDANGQAYANQMGTCSAPQTTIYIGNSTDNTYYLSLYNTATSQFYNLTINPWGSPTMNIPLGNYSVTVYTADYPTYIYVLGYSSYGTSAIYQNISVNGISTSINFGD